MTDGGPTWATLRALALAACAACLTPGAAAADDPARRGFDPDPVRPALGLDRGFAVESAAPAKPGTFDVSLLFDYSRGLLALERGDDRSALLESRLQAHVLATYAFRRLEVGVDVPIALSQHADFSPLVDQGVTGPLVAPVASSALGDVRVVARVPLPAPGAFPVDAAAVLDLRAPTGDGDAFYGDGAMAVPSMVLTRALGRVRVDAQLGYAIRRPGQYAQLVVQDGLTWGLGASVDLPRTARGSLASWRGIAELTGGWPRGNDLDTRRYRAPLAARAGLRIPLSGGFAIELGGGTGLGEAGYGREAWRAFAAVRWTASIPDRDGDGVPDRHDRCPDVFGERSLDGCTPGDIDFDGVLDPVDLCPQDPGPVELDGCPDFDLDWIPDVQDACPREPGPAQNDGCPLGDEPVVEIETDRIALRDAINFDTGKATIRPESNGVLDAIAAILKAHPDIRRVRVEGHTDNVGSAAYNKDLSLRRARAVVNALVDRGIPRERLVPTGYGFERPVASNATALGRAKNRRVEFTIIDGDATH